MKTTTKLAKRAPARHTKADADSGVAPLGARIRKLRRDRGWNLAELSRRSDIALSTLSKVENGLLSLAYDRLQQVAAAFDLSLSEFIAPPSTEDIRVLPSARIAWAKKGSGTLVDTPNYIYNYLCENLRLKAMVPIVSQCHARTLEEFGPLLKHNAEEFVFVLKGQIAVHTEYYGPENLGVGEGVYLDSRMGHAFLNAGEGDAWILSVNYNN
jgi:transcriptional regulator with XRE-family HTH domain